MIEIISCKECNNIITTSENICFYTKRYDEIIPSFKIKEKEKIMFIGDEEEIDQIRNAPNEFEFLITNSEIKCKNCGVLLGNLILKEKDIYLGTILTSKMTSMRLKNEKKDKEINIYSQKENEIRSKEDMDYSNASPSEVRKLIREGKIDYKHWFLGHYHATERVWNKGTMLYENLCSLDLNTGEIQFL